MENERYTEQDEMMRSLLQEGCESVPEGLWDQINSRLDAGEHLVAPQVHRPVWKRVVLTLSGIAAVLAAGSLLWLNTPEEPSAPEVLADVAVVHDPTPESTVLAQVTTSGEEISPIQAHAARPSAVTTRIATATSSTTAASHPAITAEASLVEESRPTAAEVPSATGKQAPSSTGKQLPSVTEESVPLTLEEDFPAEKETARRQDRMSIHIGGLTGGNFSDGMKTFGPHHSVSQPKPVKTGVIDNGGIHNDLPLTLGIGFKYNFNKRWAIATGINYTLLGRRFNGIFSDSVEATLTETRIKNTQHYIGIPLEFYYSIIKSEHIDFYTMFGGTVEMNVGNKYTLLDMDNRIWKERAEGVQCSVNIGLGVEFLLTEWLGLYIDPSLRYWFDNGQPTSIRTEQPLSVDAALGLRFRF